MVTKDNNWCYQRDEYYVIWIIVNLFIIISLEHGQPRPKYGVLIIQSPWFWTLFQSEKKNIQAKALNIIRYSNETNRVSLINAVNINKYIYFFLVRVGRCHILCARSYSRVHFNAIPCALSFGKFRPFSSHNLICKL